MPRTGRPAEYKEDYPLKVYAYMDERISERKIISRAGLSIFLDCSKQTLTNWGEAHPDFLGALGELDRAQENQLLEHGLDGRWNSTITKLVLHNHDYREKSDMTTDGKKLPTPILGLTNVSENDGDNQAG